jgi:hypothetical protein
MRQRITFVHEPQDGIDPKSIGIHTNTLSFSGLKAAREDRITFALAELPRELGAALNRTQELHVRYVTPSSYDSIPPFNSQLSPGLHVHYIPKLNARKDEKGVVFTDCHIYVVDSTSSDDLLCPIINKLFNVQDKSLCSTPEVVIPLHCLKSLAKYSRYRLRRCHPEVLNVATGTNTIFANPRSLPLVARRLYKTTPRASVRV